MTCFGVIGPGNLGEALLQKLSYSCEPWFYHRRLERCQELERKNLGLSTSLDNILACRFVFITVKPNAASQLCREIKALAPKKYPLFISVMAGVPVSFLQEQLGTGRVCRVMFDLSIKYGTPIYIYSFCKDKEEKKEIAKVEDFLGMLVWFSDETKIDTVTALFGCGPAFISRFYQSYSKIALESGIENADVYLCRLFNTTAHMLAGESPDTIINKVACKGGATERGLQHLNNIDEALAACIDVAEKRCHELRDMFSL